MLNQGILLRLKVFSRCRTYTDEFKNKLVQLYLNDKRKCDISREYDFSPSLLDKWIKQSTSTGSFEEKDNRSEEEQELIQCRKKVKQLEMGHLACEA